MSRGMIKPIDAVVTQVSIKFRTKKKALKKNMGISIGHNTNNTYGKECVPIWKRREIRMIVYMHICRN